MKWARDLETNKLVTVPMLWQLRGDEIVAAMESVKAERDVRAIVNRNVVCDECRNPVFVYGKGMVGGFVMAGHDLNDPRVEVRRAPKYNHYGKNSPRNNGVKPVKECSLYCPHIAAFKDAKKAARDPRLEKEVRARLAEPETKALNLAVLKELHRAATKKWPTETEIATYRQIALDDFMGYELLLTHPYVLPYAVVSQMPFFTRQGEKGVYKVRFKEQGDQEVLYKAWEGEERVGRIPEYLSFEIKWRGRWVPMFSDKRTFPITERQACALAGRPPTPKSSFPVLMSKGLVPLSRIVGAYKQWLPGVTDRSLQGPS